jgi:two-component system, LytTR family, response regulator
MPLRALIVDDEPLARERIRALLAQDPDVSLAGECRNGKEAVKAIREERPDLVFLDVQMPGPDAFEVIQEVGPARMPAVVFVTAYDRYALKAFDVHAVDYLLKPFDAARFHEALRRARAQIHANGRAEAERKLAALIRELSAASGIERLAVKSAGRVSFVGIDEIDYVEACGNYVRLHCGGERHLMRETLSGLESRLPARRFARIHRSTLVNLDRIRELQPLFHGDWAVVLRSGARLTLSRSYRERLRHLVDDL